MEKKNVNRLDKKQVNFRVNEDEYIKLYNNANNIGVSVSAYCRLLAKDVKMTNPKINNDVAISIASELRSIGVNINQIAKICNTNKNVGNEQIRALEDVKKELHNIWQQLN